MTARDAFAESIRAYGLEAEAGKIAEWLDRDLAIDKVLKLPDGATFTVQEKVRRHYATQYMDFTQEYLNGAGTEYENLGEWFKLNAQLYFYGWSNEEENAIPKWAIIDIVQYKRLVADAGGLDQNRRHTAKSQARHRQHLRHTHSENGTVIHRPITRSSPNPAMKTYNVQLP